MKNDNDSIRSSKNKYLIYLKLSLSSILFAYAFVNTNFAYFSLIGLVVGLKLILESRSEKTAALLGYVFGLVFFLVQSSFLITLSTYANAWAYVGWVILSLLEGVSFLFFAFALKVIHRKIKNVFLVLIFTSVIYVAIEIIRSSGVLAYQWGVAALPFAGLKNLSIVSSIFGWPGVSFVIIFICTAIALITRRELDKKSMFYSSFLIILIIATANIVPKVTKNSLNSNINVSLLQTNVDMKLKWKNGEGAQKEKELRSLFNKIKNHPDIILVPESSLPGFYPGNKDFYLSLLKKSNAKKVFAGTLRTSGNNVYNSVLGGNIIYDKNRLVPFGEYIPLRIFARLVEPLQFGLTSGKNIKLIDDIAVIICSESADSLYTREVVNKGAKLIALSTNDAWFKGSSLSDQHLQTNRFRAIENGRYLITAANYGYSSIIRPDGEVINRSELGKSQIINGKISYIQTKTFYTKYGYIINILIVVAGLFSMLYVWSSEFKK